MKKKSLVLVAMAACLSLASIFTSLAGKWQFVENSEEICFQNDDGSYTKSNWQEIYGQWYYFDENGYMETDWQWIDNKWYFLEHNYSGMMQSNVVYETGYIGDDGAWVTTKSPMEVMYAGTDEEIAYWKNLQSQYRIADLKYVDAGNGKFVYTLARNEGDRRQEAIYVKDEAGKDVFSFFKNNKFDVIPDYENIFASKACEDFNGFKYVISWDDKQISFTVWDTDAF